MKLFIFLVMGFVLTFVGAETAMPATRITIDKISVEVPSSWKVSSGEDRQIIDSGQLEKGEHVAFYVKFNTGAKGILLDGYTTVFANNIKSDSKFRFLSQKVLTESGLRYGLLEYECPGHNTGNAVHWNTYILPIEAGRFAVFEFYSEKTVFPKYQDLFKKIFLSIQ